MTPRLEQAPEGFNIIGMHIAAHIFTPGTTHRGMREGASQAMIGLGFIGRDQQDAFIDRLPNERAFSVLLSALSINRQTTFPLRAMAPMTASFSEPPLTCRFLFQWRLPSFPPI